MHTTGLTPSPCDVAAVRAILPKLADQAGVDWSAPLMSWTQDTMTNFLLLAMALIVKAESAGDQGTIIGKSKDWDTKGDGIGDIPFEL